MSIFFIQIICTHKFIKLTSRLILENMPTPLTLFFQTILQNNRRVRIQFRLLAAIPPIILAILVRELGTITDYSGTAGFVLTFSFPALLYIQTRRLAQTKSFSTETYYSIYASSYTPSSVLFFFGFRMLIFVVTLQIME